MSAPLLAFLALAAALPWERQGDRFTLKLDDGRAELDWVNPSTFRFAREWGAGPARNRPGARAPVEVSQTDAGAAVEFRSQYLTVAIRKRDLRLTIRDGQGGPLLEEIAGARRDGGAIVLESAIRPDEHIYGLGAETLGPLDRRGARLTAARGFLWSSGGYGRYFPLPDRYAFDLTGERCRIEIRGAARVEYYFYYGPLPKEILEQHVQVAPQVNTWSPADLGVLRPNRLPDYAVPLPGAAAAGWDALAETVTRLIHAGLSAVQMPVFDVSSFAAAPEPVRARAGQLAMVAPLVAGGKGETALSRWRLRMRPYLFAYFQEAHDRGIPLIRPLPMQYPRDPEAPKHSDVYMFGDELLAAPVLTPGSGRDLYLPMGIWTELRTNRVHQGRRTIRVEAGADELPLFAKNGAIVPFLEDPDSDLIAAHYFPKLGGEFFIFEPDAADHTQLHASPAGDYYRFEIESKVDREYEWVAHHVPVPKQVARGDKGFPRAASADKLRSGTWFHEAAAGNLHIRVRAAAGEDVIVNVSF